MKSNAQQALLVLAAILMLTSDVNAARFEGEISTDFETDMMYVNRFVYQPGKEAIFHYDMKIPANECCATLNIFRGIENQWPLLRKMEDEMACWEKIMLVPSIQNTRLKLAPGIGRPCYKKIDDDGSEIIQCTGTMSFTFYLQRWYYITFMNCHYQRNVGINVRYKLHFLNGDDYWNREFSADESSMLETTLSCGIILSIFIIIATIFRIQLANQHKLHTTYKIWYISLISQFIGVTILAIALFNFAIDGYERNNSKLAGHIFTSIGNVIFTTVLILMGKGFTITRLDIRRLGVVKIVFFVITYSTTFLTLYILKEKADKRDVKNIYDSEAALGLVFLRCIGLVWILYGVFFTMKNYPKKRAFYLAFTIFAVTWFLSEPFIILLSNFYLPLYCRAKVVHGVYLVFAILGHGMFLFLTRPSTTNTFFPFHLSTNKVGFEVTDEENPGTNSGIGSNSSHTKYMVEKEQALDYDRTLEKPIQTISKTVSEQDIEGSYTPNQFRKPNVLTPLQKLHKALQEVDRSIEADKAAELAQRRKLQAALGCKIGGIYDMEEEELSEEKNIRTSKEETDVTSTENDSDNHGKNAPIKNTNTATALSSDEKLPQKETITKEEAAKIKAKELEDIFVTRRPKETKATDGERDTPTKTTATPSKTTATPTKTTATPTMTTATPTMTTCTSSLSHKTQNQHLPSSSKFVTATTSTASLSQTSKKGETKEVSATKVHNLPDEPKLPSPTLGQGDVNHLQDDTKTDPKIIVTKKNKVPRVRFHAYYKTCTEEELKELFVTSEKVQTSTSNDAGQTLTKVNSFDKVTYTPVMPFNADSDQDMTSTLSPSAMSVNVKKCRQVYSRPVTGTDHKLFYKRNSSVKNVKPPAQDYRLRLGLPPVAEDNKKNEIHTSISIEDGFLGERKVKSTVVQPTTQPTGVSDRFGCGQVGLEIPGKRWVEEYLGIIPPSVPKATCNQLEVLPPDNTCKNTAKKVENGAEQNLQKNATPTTSNQSPVEEKESFALIQFRKLHGLDTEYDKKRRAEWKAERQRQAAAAALKVENKMEQLSSDKTRHHQHSNRVAKTLNKMETLPQNTQDNKQPTTMLKVENEMEHQSSHKNHRQQHPNGVVKTIKKLEQLPPEREQFHKMHRIGNEVDCQPMSIQHRMQSNTVLRVENEIEQQSSYKPKHQQHSNGVAKSLNKMEQPQPAKGQFQKVHKIGNEVDCQPMNIQHHMQSSTVLRVENEMKHQSSARGQFQKVHKIVNGNEVDCQAMNIRHHMHSSAVLIVENEMEQQSSHKPKYHQHSNGVAKTLNKMDQVQSNTQHNKQPTTMLKVENEMEHQSSHKTKHHQHPTVVVKALKKLEQQPAVNSSLDSDDDTCAYTPSSHRDLTRAEMLAAQHRAASKRDNFFKRDSAYNVTKKQLSMEVDERPQTKEECLERLRKLRDELAMNERLEQVTSPSVTTSESSLGSVLDEERGDTKKKKRKNPIHKARKMLRKKRSLEQEGQINNT